MVEPVLDRLTAFELAKNERLTLERRLATGGKSQPPQPWEHKRFSPIWGAGDKDLVLPNFFKMRIKPLFDCSWLLQDWSVWEADLSDAAYDKTVIFGHTAVSGSNPPTDYILVSADHQLFATPARFNLL